MQCYKKIAVENKTTGDYMAVNCEKCNFCLQNRRQDWSFRLMEEYKDSQNGYFMTFTYAPKYVPQIWEGDDLLAYTLDKKEAQSLIKLIKQRQRRLLGKEEYKNWRIRYFLVGEYGSKYHRPHYHFIIFNLHPEIHEDLMCGLVWGKGIVHSGKVEQHSCGYVAKYAIDSPQWSEQDKREKTFCTMSRNPGLGIGYLKRNGDWHRSRHEYHPDYIRMFRIENGGFARLPRYYRKKILQNVTEDRKAILDEGMAIYYEEMMQKFAENYEAELERLSTLHPDPLTYYAERIKYRHDQIKIKSLAQNTL